MAKSVTRWIIAYVVSVLLAFGLSFLYFSTPELMTWTWPFSKQQLPSASQPAAPTPTPPARSESAASTLKNAYNQLSVSIQKSSILLEDARKVNVPGDPKRTAVNYRAIQRSSDALLAQLALPPDSSTDIGAVVMPLKECLSLLSKSTSIMADYLDGKLSLAPPNPDWVGRSQEYSAQSQARLKDAQQALGKLRKKIE